MSNWTHVSATFRVDDIAFCSKNFDFDKIFGKQCTWSEEHFHEFCEELRYAGEHPEEYLPIGSEGSLYKTVWINPDTSAMARFVITVWGDLRDHDSIEDIEKWFRNCCEKLDHSIRQAVCLISNERNGDKIIAQRFDKEVK